MMIHGISAKETQISLSLEQNISGVAEKHGIVLSQDRLDYLVGSAQGIQRVDSGEYGYVPRIVYTDAASDITFTRAKSSEKFKRTVAERFDGTISLLDFAPVLKGDWFVRTSARPENVTIITLMAMRSFQNYALLVEAGVIEKPKTLLGFTNAEMAIVAERAGFLSDIARKNPDSPAAAHKQMKALGHMEISTTFDEMSGHVFSDEAKKLEQILVRRLATQKPAGELALAQST
jgi:hypothetical protein